LRGRSGRQGDPGRTVFFISMEDDLMRIFGSERLSSMLTKLGLKEDESIVHPLISKTIEKAQQRVESRNFDLRKNLLRFDDVMNDQRRIIYDLRVHYIHGKDLSEDCLAMRERTNRRLIAQYLKPGNFDPSWDLEGLGIALKRLYDIPFPVDVWEKEALLTDADILETIEKQLVEDYSRREMTYSAYAVRLAEKQVLLMLLDQFWKDHLHHLDQLRQGINLRAYGQKDPLLEYRRDAFELFEAMLDKLDEEVVRHLFHFELEAFDLSDQAFASLDEDDQHHHYGDALPSPEGSDALQAPSRNSPCPCGSRKKFKYCHGRVS
jgi:preprotein translocase subunit SecA